MGLSRRVWADLVFAHPDVDVENPTDEFIAAVLDAGAAMLEVDASERDVLAAYRAVLAGAPDYAWARRVIDRHPSIAVEASVCLDMGIPHSQFLDWDEESQDLAIATAVKRRDLCPAGKHPRDMMGAPDKAKVQRVYCAVCAKEHDLSKRVAESGVDSVGWGMEVTRVGR